MAQPAPDSPAPDAKDRILDAAEAEFARCGFDGAGMKAVAAAADVAQGLIHYHFGAKDRLYEAVIERRAALINAARLEMLDAVDLSAADAAREIFRAFYAPPLGPESGGPHYARMLAALPVGTDRDKALIARCYDEVAGRFIAALRQATGAGAAEAGWSYVLALGALVTVVGRDERLARLSGGAAALTDDNVLERLIDHAVGGLSAINKT